jgi:hypothetical protein
MKYQPFLKGEKMKTKKTKTRVVVSLLALAALLVYSLNGIAGNLEPSAPPGPTMKTLDEVEPRIPLNSDTAPGDPTSFYKITSPGSYYLTETITVNFKHAIVIDCDNVTVDLMGHTIQSKWYSSLPGAFLDFSGVYIEQNRKNIMIRNGTIYSNNNLRPSMTFYKGFLNGIYGTGDNSFVRVIGVSVKNSRENGIYVSGSGVVENCIVQNNGNSSDNIVYGIACGSYSTIANNKVTGTGNSAYGQVRAVYASHGSIVKGNVISDNGTNAGVVRVGGTPQDVYGIKTYDGCKIVNNTLYNNGFSTGGEINAIDVGHCCIIAENTMHLNGKEASGVVRGIRTGSGCKVANNTAYETGYEAQDNVLGLHVGMGSTVSGNSVCRNGFTASGDVSGIYVSSGVNVIGNTVTHNGVGAGGTCYGVILTGGNLFDQNTLFSNFGTELDAPPIGWTSGTNHIP